MRRRLAIAMLLSAIGAWAQTQETASATRPDPTSAAPAHFAVSGVLVNAVTGEALSKAKVWIVPATDQDYSDDQPRGPQGPGARFAGGGPGGGGGAGGFAFAGGGGRAQRQRGPTEAEPKTTETFTDANGNFVLDNVTPGVYSLYAERKGFPRQPLDQHGNFNTAVVVGAGKESKNILFRVLPDSGIIGHITDDFGDPVPNSQVILFYKTTEGGLDQVRRRSGTNTDSHGSYRFTHLQPGTYFVVVSAQPWYTMFARMMPQQASADGTTPQPIEGDANLDVAFPVTYYPNATDEDGATPIQLQPGDHYEANMTMNTAPAMHLQFTNPDPNSRMMPNITTSAFGSEIFVRSMPMVSNVAQQPGGEPVRTVTMAVAPGHYMANERQFTPEGRGPGFPPGSARRQTIDASGNSVIDMNKGEEPAPVTGTVKFEGTTEPPRGSVIFRKQNSNEAAMGRVSQDGEMQSVQLYTGKYAVSANFSRYVIKSFSAVGAKVTGRMLDISGTQPVRISLQMIADDARVEGVVHAANSDAPVASALVILVPQDIVNDQPNFRRFQSDSDGTFRFTSVIPGKYTVVAIQNGWNLEWAKPEVLKDYLAKGETIEVEAKARMKVTVRVQ